MAFAPTQSGKGVGLVIPTLLSWTGSAVIHEAYRDAYGEEEPVGELIPAMLWTFLRSDRAFVRSRRSRRHAG
jgi:hypothetical protein